MTGEINIVLQESKPQCMKIKR